MGSGVLAAALAIVLPQAVAAENIVFTRIVLAKTLAL